MKIWTLMENTACSQQFACEHGLSLYIEACGCRILFDMGQTAAFVDNAAAMGVDLSQVDFAVLSHGHYDHGGGLAAFLEMNQRAKIYVNQYAFEPHYHGPARYIGLDTALRSCGRLVYVQGQMQAAPGIWLYPSVPARYPVDCGGLQVLEADGLRQEDFRHEQYLLVEEDGKRVCFSGCSHRGIVNIAEAFRPDILIGGFHLMKVAEEDRLAAIGQALRAYPTRYYTGHCTGQAQYDFLKTRMGDRLEAIAAGVVWEL